MNSLFGSSHNNFLNSSSMKKRISASNIMRVVSILGIICLLALQWVWWRNAYRAVEMDVMSRSHECLKIAIDKAIMYQMDSTSKGIKIVNTLAGDKIPKRSKGFKPRVFNSAYEIGYTMEECINIVHRPLTDSIIDTRYCKILNKELGFIPKHILKIHRVQNQISKNYGPKLSRYTLGGKCDTIYQQFGYKAYMVVVFQSPISFYLKKGAYIFVISIILMFLIGYILVFQFINMLRDRKFADFIVDYTRMMTHDLRTPVTGVQMIFKMFGKELREQPEKQEKFINEGLTLSKKILLNLDNILYMAKSEQRGLQAHVTEVSMREFMERIVEMYRFRNYNPKTVSLVTHYEPEDFKCRMDVGLMENVMCNLIENAIKFTPKEALISIISSSAGNQVVIKVQDNGQGMSIEDQKRIFGLFERGSANKNNDFPGFGIGLHFVERVVKAHGGKVTVQSELGKGTEFTIRYTS